MSDLAAELRRFLIEEILFGEQAPSFGDDENLFDVGLDSLGILRTTAFLEKAIGHTLEADALLPEHFETLRSLIARVEEIG